MVIDALCAVLAVAFPAALVYALARARSGDASRTCVRGVRKRRKHDYHRVSRFPINVEDECEVSESLRDPLHAERLSEELSRNGNALRPRAPFYAGPIKALGGAYSTPRGIGVVKYGRVDLKPKKIYSNCCTYRNDNNCYKIKCIKIDFTNNGYFFLIIYS